ncbi:MAG: VWA domain-containing protein [Candidatus Coproplasma sp.]
MSSINFDNPYLLFIAIPLVVLLCVPFVLAVRKDNVNGHNVASAVIHIIIAAIIAFTAAGTKIITVVTQTDVYVLADVSYSANKNLDAMDEYIEELGNNLPDNSRLGIICFGKDYQLLTRLGESVKSVKEANVDDSATDIVSVLGYAGSIFRDGVVKRIVLVTDGRQSDESDPNALKRAVDALVADDVHVDAIFIDDNLAEDAHEVQVTDVEFSQNVFLNRDERASAAIKSSYNTQAMVSLYLQSEKVAERAVELASGMNYVSFTLDTSVEGTYEYEIRVQTEDDGSVYDNSVKFTQTVSGLINVLLVSDKSEDYVAVMEMYGGNAVIDPYIATTNVPFSVEELCRYDEIVISDVDVGSFNNYAMFINSVDTVVSLFGKSLITIGDVGLLKGKEELNTLANILPVNFGNSQLDPKLYTFVIDCSRSMKINSHLDTAKSAACRLVDMLNDQDDVCIIRFDGEAGVELVTTTDSDKNSIKEAINSLDVRQGTLIGNGLNAAYDYVKNLDYSEKQVLLLSDGLNYGSEEKEPVQVAREMYLDGIYTSTLYIGNKDNGYDQNVVKAINLLREISNASDPTGNSFYEIYDSSEVDSVVLDRIVIDNREDKPEGFFNVKIAKRYDSVVEGIEEAKFIRGFVNTKDKANATTVLAVEYRKPNGTNVYVPLYSYWDYGNGKVSSFTSSLTGEWISPWTNIDLYEDFFKNVFDVNTPSEKNNYPFLVETSLEKGYCAVEVTPATVRSDATVEITVILPGGQTLEGNLAFAATNYTYSFATPDTGKYLVEIRYSYGGYEYTVESTFYVSYLNEYDSFATYDASVLYKMVGGNGTVSEDGKLRLENDENEVAIRIIDLTVPMMITCVALFAVDIIIRKLKWNDIKSLFIRVKK